MPFPYVRRVIMKKRFVLVIAVILILSTLLAGCTLFSVNAERDSEQIVATVEHKGLVAEVTKAEFVNYFNQNYQTYYNYFQWSAEEMGEYFISVLARQKMNIVLAVEKFGSEKDGGINKTKFNAIVKKNVKKADVKKGYDVYAAYLLSLLDWDEQKYVKEQTNKMFKDSYDEYIDNELENEKIKAEEENNNNSSNKNTKEPRPTKDDTEDITFKKEPVITDEYIAEVKGMKTFFEEYKPNDNSTKHEKDAYKEQEKALEKSFTSYDYYLAKQAESRLLTKYQEAYKDTDLDSVNIRINENLKNTLNEQMKAHKTADSYKSAMEGDSVVIYHNGRYVRVKSILLQFSDEQKSALEFIQKKFTGDAGEEYVKQLREALVFGNVDGSLDIPALLTDKLGLEVYKSNPDYDPKKPASDPADKESGTNYPYIPNEDYDPEKDDDSKKWVSEPFLDVIVELGKAIEGVNESAAKDYDKKYASLSGYDSSSEAYQVGKQMFINQKKAELFEDWIYSVNDDSGMFGGTEYTETPVGNSSDYVVEYTALVRQLLSDNGTAGSVKVDTTSGKSFVDGVVTTTAKVGEEDIVTIYTSTEGNISFIVNDFGVHIVMLTTVPVDFGYNGDINDSNKHYTVEENVDFDMEQYNPNKYSKDELAQIREYNSFYILKETAYIAFDEETGKAITVREKIGEGVQDTYDEYVYSEHSKKLYSMYGEKLFDKKDDKEPAKGYADYKFELTLHKSVYNSIIKRYKF